MAFFSSIVWLLSRMKSRHQKVRQAMKRKARLPFDPKMFLSKVNGGTTHFRLSERSDRLQAGRSCGCRFLHSERQGQKDRRLRAGQGSRGRSSGSWRFLRRGLLGGRGAASVDGLRSDEMYDRANIKAEITRVIHEEPAFAELFISHLLARNSRVEEDLVDQLFNSSEKRLARTLLLLANFGKEGRPEPIIAKVSQETLAEMIGTTRSRVSFFMNKFRKLGLIDYNGSIEIHSSLLNVVLRDQPQFGAETFAPGNSAEVSPVPLDTSSPVPRRTKRIGRMLPLLRVSDAGPWR